MKAFLQEYGTSLLCIIMVVMMIAISTPVGSSVSTALKGTVGDFSRMVNGDKSGDDGLMGKADGSMRTSIIDVCEIPRYISEKQTLISDDIPSPNSKKYRNWIFSGWFEDNECTIYVDNKNDKLGEIKYAKFVPNDILSVKFQIDDNISSESEKATLKVVSSVDSLKYSKVGFQITVGSNTINHTSDKGYKKINGTKFKPTDFSYTSTYMFSANLTNIPNQGFDKDIVVRPFWITQDGTTVLGAKYTTTINELISEK